MAAVRKRRRGYTRLTSKHQATIPVDVLEQTGIKPGDELKVEPGGPGWIVLRREESAIEKFAGTLRGVYYPGYLDELRSEWDR